MVILKTHFLFNYQIKNKIISKIIKVLKIKLKLLKINLYVKNY